MKVIHTDDPAFLVHLVSFAEQPRLIPANSIIVANDKMPIILVGIYHDAGMIFIHGLYKSKFSSNKDFLKAVKFSEEYLRENLMGKFPIVTFTQKKSIKKIFIRNGFDPEETILLGKAAT